MKESHNAVKTLHTPDFLLPRFHTGRKGQPSEMLEYVEKLRTAGIGAGDTSAGKLDVVLEEYMEERLNEYLQLQRNIK